MNVELARIIHSVILDSPIPAKVLAKQVGKPYSTLLREANPYDSGAKLGIETLVELLKLTGDTRTIEYIANELGYDIVPRGLRKAG